MLGTQAKRQNQTSTLRDVIRDNSYVLKSMEDLYPLIRKLKDSKIVMLGEASHGTHEYYLWRSYISRRLISEHGFDFIGVEGDWPDCYRINRYIKGYTESGDSASEVLHKFKRDRKSVV